MPIAPLADIRARAGEEVGEPGDDTGEIKFHLQTFSVQNYSQLE